MKNWEDKLRDAYDSLTPDKDSKEMMLDRILCSSSFDDGKEGNMEKEKKGIIRFPLKKTVAAIICAACLGTLGATALANGWFGLGSVSTGHTVTERNAEVLVYPTNEWGGDFEPEDGEAVPTSVKENVTIREERELISLAGTAGTPEYEAQKEWNEFYWDYLMTHIDEISDDYSGIYSGVYSSDTEEMDQKLTQILEKYGLSAHKECKTVSSEEELCEAIGIERVFDGIEIASASGYYYDDGSFHLEAVTEAKDGEYYVLAVDRQAKGVFNEVMINVGDISTMEEGDVVTDTGVHVGTAIREHSYPDSAGHKVEPLALLIADGEAAFVTVSMEKANDQYGGMVPTAEEAAAIANAVCFKEIIQ